MRKKLTGLLLIISLILGQFECVLANKEELSLTSIPVDRTAENINKALNWSLSTLTNNAPQFIRNLGLNVGYNNGSIVLGINSFQPFWSINEENVKQIAFGQLKYSNTNNTINLGAGYRYMHNEDTLYGANVFYDIQPQKHQRIGVGFEYYNGAIEQNLNVYKGISSPCLVKAIDLPDEKQQILNAIGKQYNLYERVVDGVDLSIISDLRSVGMPYSKLGLTGYGYFCTEAYGNTANKNIAGCIGLANVQLTPQINLNLNYDFIRSNGVNVGFNFNLFADKNKPALSGGNNRIYSQYSTSIAYKFKQPVHRSNTITTEQYTKLESNNLKTTIEIEAKDDYNNKLNGLNVVLAGNNEVTKQGETDISGLVVFRDVPNADYTVQIKDKDGIYADKTERIEAVKNTSLHKAIKIDEQTNYATRLHLVSGSEKLNNVVVKLIPQNNNKIYSAITDANGTAIFKHIPQSGQYNLVINDIATTKDGNPCTVDITKQDICTEEFCAVTDKEVQIDLLQMPSLTKANKVYISVQNRDKNSPVNPIIDALDNKDNIDIVDISQCSDNTVCYEKLYELAIKKPSLESFKLTVSENKFKSQTIEFDLKNNGTTKEHPKQIILDALELAKTSVLAINLVPYKLEPYITSDEILAIDLKDFYLTDNNGNKISPVEVGNNCLHFTKIDIRNTKYVLTSSNQKYNFLSGTLDFENARDCINVHNETVVDFSKEIKLKVLSGSLTLLALKVKTKRKINININDLISFEVYTKDNIPKTTNVKGCFLKKDNQVFFISNQLNPDEKYILRIRPKDAVAKDVLEKNDVILNDNKDFPNLISQDKDDSIAEIIIPEASTLNKAFRFFPDCVIEPKLFCYVYFNADYDLSYLALYNALDSSQKMKNIKDIPYYISIDRFDYVPAWQMGNDSKHADNNLTTSKKDFTYFAKVPAGKYMPYGQYTEPHFWRGYVHDIYTSAYDTIEVFEDTHVPNAEVGKVFLDFNKQKNYEKPQNRTGFVYFIKEHKPAIVITLAVIQIALMGAKVFFELRAAWNTGNIPRIQDGILSSESEVLGEPRIDPAPLLPEQLEVQNAQPNVPPGFVQVIAPDAPRILVVPANDGVMMPQHPINFVQAQSFLVEQPPA